MAEVNKNVQNDAKELVEEEVDFATMLEESFKDTGSDSLVEGIIVEIKDDAVLVDVGKKSEGRLNISEILDKEGNPQYKKGDTIKVLVTGYRNERPNVSYKKAIKKEKVKEFIDNYDEQNDILEVQVVGKNRGGFIVENEEGADFFMPRSQAAVRDANSLIGKKIKVAVIKVDKEEQSVLVSRKKLLDEDRKRRKDIIKKLLESEDVVEGNVKKITTYGMFVDVGGVDGLVHYSEISYKGPVNPGSLYKEGDIVPVKAIKYDNEKRHLSLSIKAAMPDPWEEIKDALDVGDAIEVTVSNIEPYGAFVDLGNDIEGFLHISEISWDKNIKHPKDHIQENQTLNVEVIEIDFEERRLRVSLKQLLPKPFEEFSQNYKVGDVVTGKVTAITNFGAFVKIGSIEGLLHNEDVSWDREEKCKELLKVGDDVEVKIVRIDSENQKISLSKRELEKSPIQEYAKSHKNGDVVTGKIRDVKDFGIFVELDKNVDALIRKEDLGSTNVEDLNVGDDIEAVITFLDENKNRIRLSVRRLSRIKEREVLNEINKDDKMTLGDILKDQLS